MSSNRKSTRKASVVIKNSDIDYNHAPVRNEHKKKKDNNQAEEHDPVALTIDFLYRYHSIALLAFLIVGLVVASFMYTSPTDNLSNGFNGLGAAALVFIVFGLHEFDNGPAFFRVVLAVSIIYLVADIVLLFQNAETARKWMSLIDPALGVPLPQKSYCEDCSLTWENIMDKMDMFVPAHFFGWMVKALIIRDAWLCWVISIMFEVMEYSLEFQMPNFGECWWDHWVWDLILCNGIGIWLGMRICDYFSMKTYHWQGIGDIPEKARKVVRPVTQFSPPTLTSFDWATTKTFKGYLVTIFLFLMGEVSGFYLKALLWIPLEHFIFTFRRCKKLGTQTWIALAICIVEALICIKFGKDELPRDIPKAVVYFWGAFTTLIVLFPVYQFWWRPSRKLKF